MDFSGMPLHGRLRQHVTFAINSLSAPPLFYRQNNFLTDKITVYACHLLYSGENNVIDLCKLQ